VEEVEDEAVEGVGEFGVVAEALVAHEGVGSVDLVPAELLFEFVEAGEDGHAAFEWDVRVLASPDHEEFALDLFCAFEGVVSAFAEGAFVNVGGVEAGSGEDVGVHCGAEGEMAADADTHGTEVAGAVGAGFEVVERGAGVGVVTGEFFCGLEGVAAVGAGLVVGEDGAGGFELVVDLGHGNDVAVAREHGGGAADRRGDLEDFGVEDDAGIAAGRGGADDVGSHGAVGGVERDVFVVDDDHVASRLLLLGLGSMIVRGAGEDKGSKELLIGIKQHVRQWKSAGHGCFLGGGVLVVVIAAVIAAVFFVVGVALYACRCWVYVGMCVGVNVDVAVVVGAAPCVMVDHDGVSTPAEACTVPSVDAEGRADGDGGAEADSCGDDETGAWTIEDDSGAVDGYVEVGWIDGLDFDVAAAVGDGVVGVGNEVAVVVGEAALALDSVHDVSALAEDGVAEGAGPLWVASHRVEDIGEGQEGEDAGVPGEIVGLDGLGEGIAGHEAVLLGPGGGVGNFVPEGGGGEDLREERVGIEGDALD
jgi:hypothetical protein